MFITSIKHILLAIIIGLANIPVLAQTSISGNAQSLSYSEGDSAVVDGSITINSASGGGNVASGYIQVISGYQSDEDTLLFTTAPSINNSWNESQGRLDFTKGAKDTQYESVYQSIYFYNSSDDPDLNDRVVKFSITDKGGTNVTFERTLTITPINDAPWLYEGSQSEAVDTLTFNVIEDQTKNICPAIYDPEGDNYTITIEVIANSSGTVNVDGTNQCFDYTPNADFYGDEYVQISICDDDTNQECQSAIIHISVQNVNDQPTIGGETNSMEYTENDPTLHINESLTISDDGTTLMGAFAQISGNYDATQDSLEISGSHPAITQVWNDNQGLFEFTGSATLAEYRSLLRAIGYINKSENPSTSDRAVQMGVSDASLDSDTVTTTITIIAENDAPYIYETNISIKSDTIQLAASEDVTLQFCPNVYDAESDKYEIEIVQVPGYSADVTSAASDGCYDYTPATNSNETEYFELKTCDTNDSGLCNIVVYEVLITPVNDFPEIRENGSSADTIYYTTDLNTTVNICLEAYDVESDGVSLSTATPMLGAVSNIDSLCFDYTPNLNQVGTEYLQVAVCETGSVIACDTAIIEIQFPTINTAPEFDTSGQDTISNSLLVSEVLQQSIDITDLERDDIALDTFYVVTGTGTLEATLTTRLDYTFTPVFSDSLTSTALYFKACDNRATPLCSELVINVDINYPPILLNTNEEQVDSIYIALLENTYIDTLFTLFDLNGQSVFNRLISPLDSSLSATVNSSEQKIQLSYTAFTDFQGVDIYTLTLSDDGDPQASTDIPVVFEVFPTNYPPVFTELESGTTTLSYLITENSTLDTCLTVVDNEGDLFTIRSLETRSGPGQMTATELESKVCLSYAPELNLYGNYIAELTVIDDNYFPLSETITLTIELTPLNDEPVLANDSVTLTQIETLTLNLLSNDSDPENEGLFIDDNIESLTEELGMLTIETDSTVSYAPDPDEYKGTDTYSVTICDNGVPQSCLTSLLSFKFDLPIPSLEVYEAFSPNGDETNDTWFIDGIREFPDNRVIVKDQFNNSIYDAEGYNNKDIIWTGISKRENNGPAPEGTYYYVIDLGTGSAPITGFVILKR